MGRVGVECRELHENLGKTQKLLFRFIFLFIFYVLVLDRMNLINHIIAPPQNNTFKFEFKFPPQYFAYWSMGMVQKHLYLFHQY